MFDSDPTTRCIQITNHQPGECSFGGEGLLNRDAHPNRRFTSRRVPVLILVGVWPVFSLRIDNLLFWVTPCNTLNRFATGTLSVRMGEGGAVCAILTSAWVTSWEGQSGNQGGGGGSAMVVNLSFFLMSQCLFLWKRCR